MHAETGIPFHHVVVQLGILISLGLKIGGDVQYLFDLRHFISDAFPVLLYLGVHILMASCAGRVVRFEGVPSVLGDGLGGVLVHMAIDTPVFHNLGMSGRHPFDTSS